MPTPSASTANPTSTLRAAMGAPPASGEARSRATSPPAHVRSGNAAAGTRLQLARQVSHRASPAVNKRFSGSRERRPSLAARAAYYAAHRAERLPQMRAYSRVYYRQHRERLLAAKRIYDAAHREVILARKRARRAAARTSRS